MHTRIFYRGNNRVAATSPTSGHSQLRPRHAHVSADGITLGPFHFPLDDPKPFLFPDSTKKTFCKPDFPFWIRRRRKEPKEGLFPLFSLATCLPSGRRVQCRVRDRASASAFSSQPGDAFPAWVTICLSRAWVAQRRTTPCPGTVNKKTHDGSSPVAWSTMAER